MKVSVVLATFNEQENIGECLDSVKDIASEIIIVDGSSTDKTVEIAEKYGANILVTDNPAIFHINKQKAIDMAKDRWILQLDADERVSKPLASEIMYVTDLDNFEIGEYQATIKDRDLFLRHQKMIEERDGKVGNESSEFTAFFIPRKNFFLGKYLTYGGVYPDGVIRLFKKGMVHFPSKNVHEQIEVDGKVGWLQNTLLHKDSPTFKRYLERNSRYIDLMVEEFKERALPRNIKTGIDYLLIKPVSWFFMTQVRHKGVLDGWQGIVFSLFSALRFPRAYLRYLIGEIRL